MASYEFSDSNLGRVSYEREAVFGELNSPFNAQVVRLTSSALEVTKETSVSDELRADRMVGDLVETAFTSGGEMGFELSLGGTWDDFLESLICGTYTTPTAFTGDLTVVAATQTISDPATGGTLAANLTAGDYFYVAGMANAGNNGWHLIASVTDADTIVVTTDVADLTDETTATGTVTVTGMTLRNPGDPANIVKRSYNLAQYFSDIDVAQLFLGQRLGTLSLTTAASSLVTGSWGFMGTEVRSQEGSGDYPDDVTGPTCTDVVGATANVGTIKIDGVASTCLVQSIDLTVDNNLRNQFSIGNKYPCGIGYGRQLITGTVSLYFLDLDAYNAFLNHTDASLEWSYVDNAGNAMHFYLPRIKFATGSPTLEGIDTDVSITLDFQAIAYSEDCTDPTKPTFQIQITVANAPVA